MSVNRSHNKRMKSLSCAICKQTAFTWCDASTPTVSSTTTSSSYSSGEYKTTTSTTSKGGPLYLHYPELRETGRRGPFGGPVRRRSRKLIARVCETCGDIEMFVGDWS